MIRSLAFILSMAGCFSQLLAQNLSFTRPQPLVPGVFSDKAPSFARFKEHHFIAWKDTGAVGTIRISYMTQNQKVGFTQKPAGLQGAFSAFAPVLEAGKDQLYMFWVGNEGHVHYVINTSQTGFEGAQVHTVKMTEPMLNQGISVVFLEQKFIIAAQTPTSNRLMLAACPIDENGVLQEAVLIPVKGARSDHTPVVTAVEANSVARVGWVDHKSEAVYYADYTPANNAWQLTQSLTGATHARAPSVYQPPGTDRLIWLWKGNKKDGRLRYGEETDGEMPDEGTVLPDYFSTPYPVAITSLDETTFMIAYTGIDQKLYLSYGATYNPASWMGDLLLPSRKKYSLKDVVIPGAHDAGMSVLTGVGGKGEKTINDCNTLTQVQSIEKQLNAGIRMFDLRIDQKKGELFTKHAPSDCMEDAIAGGYGEKLSGVLKAVRKFLTTNKNEFVILSFTHFCEKDLSLADQAKMITETLGEENLFYANGKKLADILLQELAGKVMITFEDHAFPEMQVNANSMTQSGSNAFINYRREYAATNQINKLLLAQKEFFTQLKGNVLPNDLIRLDWQLTEASQEAVFICNDFETEKANPLVGGFILLANVVKKNKSIRELSLMGGRYLPGTIMEWVDNTTITQENKPNILYVDVAGTWITEFCIALNRENIYQK